MCNLNVLFINKQWGFLWAQTVLHSQLICFYFVMRGVLCLSFTNLNSMPLQACLTTRPRYLDDIFTIDNPEFKKHIPDIYPTEVQLNKVNISDKGTSPLDLNIKVIDTDVHTSVYDKRDDPIVNFPLLSFDVPRLPSYGVYISQLERFNFARCCTYVSDVHSKTVKLLPNSCHRVTDNRSF